MTTPPPNLKATVTLLPCPWCGTSDNVRMSPPTCTRQTPYNANDRAYPVVRCHNCYVEVSGKDWDKYGNSAIEKWNTRPVEQVGERMRCTCCDPGSKFTPEIGEGRICRTCGGLWSPAPDAVAVEAGVVEGGYRPSDFARVGNPSCSKWGKSEIEWIALAYVQALANDGDTWKKLTREQTYALLTDEQKRRSHGMLTYNDYQDWFDTVSSQIVDADGALGVGGFWHRRDIDAARLGGKGEM